MKKFKKGRLSQQNVEKNSNNTIQGVGVSARPSHFTQLLEKKEFPWLECLADNYLHKGSLSRKNIRQLSEIYPLVFHCVGTSIGSSEDFDWKYLKSLKELVTELKPKWISDHLCFTSFQDNHYHDLIPIPYTEENARYIANRITKLQDFFEIPFLIENVSNYMTYSSNTMEEASFLNEIVSLSHSKLLLDVNNIYVNSVNHGFDAYKFIDQIDLGRVGQIHLAGYKDMGEFLIDTHSEPVHENVLELYQYTQKRSEQMIPTCLEWDTDIPSFESFKSEQQRIKKVYE